MHINSFIKLHTSIIWQGFSWNHNHVSKSKENNFKHKKWKPCFSQHNQPFQANEHSLESALCNLSKAYHGIKKEEIEIFTWLWRNGWNSGILRLLYSNRWPLCFAMLNAWRKPAHPCLKLSNLEFTIVMLIENRARRELHRCGFTLGMGLLWWWAMKETRGSSRVF